MGKPSLNQRVLLLSHALTNISAGDEMADVSNALAYVLYNVAGAGILKNIFEDVNLRAAVIAAIGDAANKSRVSYSEALKSMNTSE